MLSDVHFATKRFEKTCIPARFWNNLERDYQEGKAKSAERKRLEAE